MPTLSNHPTLRAIPFAGNAGASYINTIPNASQIGTTDGAASYNDGFPPLTMIQKAAGGVPPDGKDFNGIFLDLSKGVRWHMLGGGYQYDSTFATGSSGYPLGARILNAAGDGYWLNTVDGNTADPTVSGSGWVPDSQYGFTAVTMTSSNVTLTQTQAAKDIIILSGVLTANLNLVFPTWTKRWTVINNCTGAFTVTCKTASGTGVATLSQGYQTAYSIYGDGTNIVQAKAVATTGITGAVRNLKCSVTTASASATFTADEVIVSTALGGINYQLSSLSQTINLATTGAGGMDTGTAPASGFVAIYAIYNPTTGATALLASNATSSAAPEVYSNANMPSGYTASALVSVWPTNASSQFAVAYQIDRDITIINTSALSTTSASTSLASLSIASCVPLNAKKVKLSMTVQQNTSGSGVGLNVGAGTTSVGLFGLSAASTSGTSSQSSFYKLSLVTPQVIYWQSQNTNSGVYSISVIGYSF
jgi:hypothetical protein